MGSLALNKTISNELRKYIEPLTPKFRIAFLCFDVFRVLDLNDTFVLFEGDATPPHYCIVLAVKFPFTSKHQIIGNINYYNGVKYFKLANFINSYVYDLCDIGVDIVASISSGKDEIIKILEAFPWHYTGIRDLSYSICEYTRIIHFFDPSWLIVDFANSLKTQDLSFIISDMQVKISYSDISRFLTDNCDDLLSSNTNTIDSSGDDIPNYIYFFNMLFETFNGNAGNRNPFLDAMNYTSIHHLFWRVALNVFNTMQFIPINQIYFDTPVDNTIDEWKNPVPIIDILIIVQTLFYEKYSYSPLKFKVREFIKVLKFSSPKSDQFEYGYKETREEMQANFLPRLHKQIKFSMLSEEIKENIIGHSFEIINITLRETLPCIKGESNNWKNLNSFKMWSLTLINCLSLYEKLSGLEIHSLDTNQLNNNVIHEMIKHVQRVNGLLEYDGEDENWACDMINKDLAEFAMTRHCSVTFRK